VAPGEDAAIVDEGGREVLLRGVNVNQLGDYFQADPSRPTVFPLTEEDFSRIGALGFNVVRLVLSWSALEPTRGAFDQGYVARIRQAVDWARAHGVRIVLDMHQDAWGKDVATPPGTSCPAGLSPAIGWDGAPSWATYFDGMTTCRLADTREFSAAVTQAFQNFYFDRDAIQEELVRTWARLARAFAADTNVAGFDLLNEPHPGFLIPADTSLLLGRFYGRAIDAIRAAEREVPGGYPHIVFFEPSAVWSGAAIDLTPPAGFTNDRNVVFAPHLYGGSISITPVTVEQGFQVAESVAASYGAPLWSGEWGWFGEPEGDRAEVLRYALEEDRAGIGGAWWSWREACGDPHVMDGHPEVTLSLNRYSCPGDHPLGLTAAFASVLSRAFPRAVPGRLTGLTSDPDSGRFLVRGRDEDPGGDCRVEVWVPDTGRGAPAVSATGIESLSVRGIEGGYLVTGCAGREYELRGEPSGGAAPTPSCLPRRLRLSSRGLGRIGLARTRAGVRRRAGRPERETPHAMRYCVRGGGAVAVAFDRRGARGRSRLLVSTARGHRAGRHRVGSLARRARRRFGRGLRVRRGLRVATRRTLRARVVLGLGVRRVRFVGVADRRLPLERRRLERYLRRLEGTAIRL
jgi:endoglycosylceramidase